MSRTLPVLLLLRYDVRLGDDLDAMDRLHVERLRDVLNEDEFKPDHIKSLQDAYAKLSELKQHGLTDLL